MTRLHELSAVPLSSSPEQGIAYANPIELAVIWVEKGRKGSSQWVDECPEAQVKTYRLRKRLKYCFYVTKWLFLLLAFVEEPSWCLRRTDCFQKEMYTSGIPCLPFELSNSLELVFLMTFIFRIWLRRKSLGKAHELDFFQTFATVCLAVSIADCTVGAFNLIGIVPTSFRITRVCRPMIFLGFSKPLRVTLVRVLRSIPHFFDVLVSLALCVIFFVWIGLILFARTGEGSQQFGSFADAFAAIWILFTTANFPDVMVPAYNESRFSFLFFFVYLVATLYLLNNVLLAAVYDAYKEQLKQSFRNFEVRRQLAIDHAFALLVGRDHAITPEKWRAFFTCFCGTQLNIGNTSDPEDRFYTLQRADFVFLTLKTDGNEGLTREEFGLIFKVLQDMHIPRGAPPACKLRGARALQTAFLRGVEIRGQRIKWDSLVNILIATDMIITFIATIVFVTPADGGRFAWVWTHRQVWHWVSFAYSCLYFLEVSLKICLLGPDRFWNRRPFVHRFDFVVVYSQFSCELVVNIDIALPDITYRALVLLRIVRMLRLVEHLRPLRRLARLLRRLISVYWNMCLLLVIVYYIYATAGEQLFGGLITPSNEALHGTDFEELNYWGLNFNDFFCGMVTLFTLMVVNNWFVIADGYLRVTGTYATAIFFVSFFVIANLIVLNILMALILDCSASLREEIEENIHERHIRSEVRSRGERRTDRALQAERVIRRMLLADESFQQDASGPAAGSSARHSQATQLPGPARSLSFQSMGGHGRPQQSGFLSPKLRRVFSAPSLQ